MAKFEDKRSRVVGEEGGRSSMIYIIPVLAIAFIAAFFFLSGSGGAGSPSGDVVNVAELDSNEGTKIEVKDYAGLKVEKKVVAPLEDGGYVGVSLEDLQKYRLLYFTAEGRPVIVYVDTNGNIITAIAECEPCHNRDKFFIQDNLLVCGACFTKWELGSHNGVSGGCKEYPPEIIDNMVKDDNVYVKKEDLINWRPRI